MNLIKGKHLEGERALFQCEDSQIESCLFDNGESPLKEGKNLIVVNTDFGWKYPLWYNRNLTVKNCHFLKDSKSGLWYVKNGTFSSLDIEAIKEFRYCEGIRIEDTSFHHGAETLWNCKDVSLKRLEIQEADYFGFHSSDIEGEKLHLVGNYCFDSGKNIYLKDSVLLSKDAFWNAEHVLLVNCVIEGEYFGWNSSDITLIHCTIKSHQGFCYMKNLKLIDCKIEESDLIFEYCENIDVTSLTPLSTVKNPISGKIKAPSIECLIENDAKIDHTKVLIESEVKSREI